MVRCWSQRVVAMAEEIPTEVILFCKEEGTLNYIAEAVEIVKRSFIQTDNIAMEVEEDPETGEKWVLIAMIVRGGVEEILKQYDRYTESWVSSVPWPECHKIRLSFDIV